MAQWTPRAELQGKSSGFRTPFLPNTKINYHIPNGSSILGCQVGKTVDFDSIHARFKANYTPVY
jgi:hypothetical protein